MGGRLGERLVVPAEPEESDVVADNVLVGVQAKLEDSLGVGQTAGGHVVCTDDLVGSRNDVEGGCESKGNRFGLLEDSLAVLLDLGHWRGLGQGGEGKSGE